MTYQNLIVHEELSAQATAHLIARCVWADLLIHPPGASPSVRRNNGLRPAKARSLGETPVNYLDSFPASLAFWFGMSLRSPTAFLTTAITFSS